MITDTFLRNSARAMAGESHVYPNYLLTSTSEALVSIGTQATSLPDETGDRLPLTTTRTGRQLNYVATRTPAFVVDGTNGDRITAAGLSSASSGTDLHAGFVIGGITHTTNFNIEFDFGILVDRA